MPKILLTGEATGTGIQKELLVSCGIDTNDVLDARNNDEALAKITPDFQLIVLQWEEKNTAERVERILQNPNVTVCILLNNSTDEKSARSNKLITKLMSEYKNKIFTVGYKKFAALLEKAPGEVASLKQQSNNSIFSFVDIIALLSRAWQGVPPECLVVDDASINRRLLIRTLCDKHQVDEERVVQAENADEALEVAKRFKDYLHCFVLDVNMPGENGVYVAAQLLRVIYKGNENIKIYIWSGDPLEGKAATLYAELYKEFPKQIILVNAIRSNQHNKINNICDHLVAIAETLPKSPTAHSARSPTLSNNRSLREAKRNNLNFETRISTPTPLTSEQLDEIKRLYGATIVEANISGDLSSKNKKGSEFLGPPTTRSSTWSLSGSPRYSSDQTDTDADTIAPEQSTSTMTVTPLSKQLPNTPASSFFLPASSPSQVVTVQDSSPATASSSSKSPKIEKENEKKKDAKSLQGSSATFLPKGANKPPVVDKTSNAVDNGKAQKKSWWPCCS